MTDFEFFRRKPAASEAFGEASEALLDPRHSRNDPKWQEAATKLVRRVASQAERDQLPHNDVVKTLQGICKMDGPDGTAYPAAMVVLTGMVADSRHPSDLGPTIALLPKLKDGEEITDDFGPIRQSLGDAALEAMTDLDSPKQALALARTVREHMPAYGYMAFTLLVASMQTNKAGEEGYAALRGVAESAPEGSMPQTRSLTLLEAGLRDEPDLLTKVTEIGRTIASRTSTVSAVGLGAFDHAVKSVKSDEDRIRFALARSLAAIDIHGVADELQIVEMIDEADLLGSSTPEDLAIQEKAYKAALIVGQESPIYLGALEGLASVIAQKRAAGSSDSLIAQTMAILTVAAEHREAYEAVGDSRTQEAPRNARHEALAGKLRDFALADLTARSPLLSSAGTLGGLEALAPRMAGATPEQTKRFDKAVLDLAEAEPAFVKANWFDQLAFAMAERPSADSTLNPAAQSLVEKIMVPIAVTYPEHIQKTLKLLGTSHQGTPLGDYATEQAHEFDRWPTAKRAVERTRWSVLLDLLDVKIDTTSIAAKADDLRQTLKKPGTDSQPAPSA